MRSTLVSALILSLAAAALLPACTTVTRSATRVAAPSDPQGSKASRSVRLSLDEHLRAELRTTDAVASVVPRPSGGPASAAPAAPPLGLALRFQTRVLGYSFDPGQLVLRDGKGGEWKPAAASAGRMKYGECQVAAAFGEPRGGYVPLAEGSCILVQFDRAVGAGDRLDLVVSGAALGKRRLEPVTVGLVRVESTWREANDDVVKVLTLPLKILLLPLAMYGG
jgi:hypothetical protein